MTERFNIRKLYKCQLVVMMIFMLKIKYAQTISTIFTCDVFTQSLDDVLKLLQHGQHKIYCQHHFSKYETRRQSLTYHNKSRETGERGLTSKLLFIYRLRKCKRALIKKKKKRKRVMYKNELWLNQNENYFQRSCSCD